MAESHPTDMYWSYYITDEVHGGKITCHKCGMFVLGDKHGLPNDNFVSYTCEPFKNKVWFCKGCFNPYEHYYGLDRPID